MSKTIPKEKEKKGKYVLIELIKNDTSFLYIHLRRKKKTINT